MKRTLAAVVSLMLLMTLFSFGALSVTAAQYNDQFTYQYDTTPGMSGRTVTVSGYVDYYATEITIPATIDGYPVTQIAPQAFAALPMLKQVSLPDGLVVIGSYAFQECCELTDITIPDSVLAMGNHAFSGCTAMTEVTIGDGLAEIPKQAFYNCSNLQTVTVGNSVTTVQNRAFAQCPALTTLFFPQSLTTIGAGAFLNSSRLTDVYYGGSESDWQAIVFGDGYGYLSPAWVTWHYDYTPLIPGDANGDKKVNNRDLAVLQQYLNEWDVSIEDADLDVNDDGKVNNRDLALLQQYLNEWDVELK